MKLLKFFCHSNLFFFFFVLNLYINDKKKKKKRINTNFGYEETLFHQNIAYICYLYNRRINKIEKKKKFPWKMQNQVMTILSHNLLFSSCHVSRSKLILMCISLSYYDHPFQNCKRGIQQKRKRKEKKTNYITILLLTATAQCY